MLIDVLAGIAGGFVDLVLLPWHLWRWSRLESLDERMEALTLAGLSVEFLYVVLAVVLLLIAAGLASRRVLRGSVRALEGFNRTLGRAAAWLVLLLMLQQVLIIVMGQVFRGNTLLFAPFGVPLAREELQWLSGQLKFYNALLIAFACAYTFIEGGHVRVDLVYGALGRRARHWLDLIGTLLFMLPTTILLWWFAWPLAMNALFSQRPLNVFSDRASWRGVRLETSGTAEFTWVWAFKILIVVFAGLLFLQAVAFLLRNIWGLVAPEEAVPTHPREIPEAVAIPPGPAPASTDDSSTQAGESAADGGGVPNHVERPADDSVGER